MKTEFEELNVEISPNGRWLAYQSNSSGALMRVEVTPGTIWKASAPGRLFDASAYGRPAGLNAPSLARTYDVSRDGRRFLMVKAADLRPAASTPDRIVVVQNWAEELSASSRYDDPCKIGCPPTIR